MRDKQDRLPGFLPDLQQFSLQPLAGLGIDRTERLIHEEQRWIDRQRSRQGDALFHPTRERFWIAILEARKANEINQLIETVQRHMESGDESELGDISENLMRVVNEIESAST